MSVLYHEPRAPHQVRRERLAFLLLLATATVLAVIVFATDRGEPAHGRPPLSEVGCEVEDEVVVRLEADAYDLAAGALFCIHIDNLIPTNEETPQ